MKIQCKKCGHAEVTNLDLFVKIIGAAAPVGGFWAWTAYLFAGTGFALPIVSAIIAGGVGMLIFKEQIVEWVTNKGYECPKCFSSSWRAFNDMVSQDPTPEERRASWSTFDDLGEGAELIIDAVNESSNDRELILNGTAAILGLTQAGIKTFGLAVQRGSAFADLKNAQREENLEEMLSIIKSMAYSLKQVDSRYDRGALLYYFFTGAEQQIAAKIERDDIGVEKGNETTPPKKRINTAKRKSVRVTPRREIEHPEKIKDSQRDVQKRLTISQQSLKDYERETLDHELKVAAAKAYDRRMRDRNKD